MENDNKEGGAIDPDYQSYNSALEHNEEEDKKENLVKLRKIIEEQYNLEITDRQTQIEQIEVQICKVRKLLHLVRYVLIMSYYRRKDLEYSGTEEPSTSDCPDVFDKQNRIHPAVKRLLGENANNLEHLRITDKRKSRNNSNDISLTKNENEEMTLPDRKRIKLEVPEIPVKVEEIKESPKREENQVTLEVIRNRKKSKHRILVGNISKWMPSSEEDTLTHKWMVYVRGPKESPDISHFVQKVVFYLHPSYKPYDVVEVSESPFHLSRRGWGEFPVRVQIFFTVTFNKPIDVIHNIKLDKTYSGRQILGNETLIDIFLHDNDKEEPTDEQTQMKTEETNVRVSTSSEHDYCVDAIKMEPMELEETEVVEYQTFPDHTYCLTSTTINTEMTKQVFVQDENNPLIHGLDKSYTDALYSAKFEVIKPKQVIQNSLNQMLKLHGKDVKLNNSKIIILGDKFDVGKILQLSNLNEQNYKITFPRNKFKNMGEALSFIFKRIPLYSELAKYTRYKQLYPFTASSLKEYNSWNIGKRRVSEWNRARAIQNTLKAENIFGIEKWNIKSIIMYGRSHAYTPFSPFGLFVRDSIEKLLLRSCYLESDKNMRPFSLSNCSDDDPDMTINVESDVESSPKRCKNSVQDVSDPALRLECTFVKQTALDCGIVLKPEEMDEDTVFNGAERMILEAVKCLADNLIRGALNHRICTTSIGPNSVTISKEDVEMAMNERPEMLALTKSKRKRKNIEFFT